MKKAQIISVDGSQAVRLPDEFRFDDGKPISIRREGNAVILEPVTTEDSAAMWPDGFFDRIRIDDPSFARASQGDLPPVSAFDSQ